MRGFPKQPAVLAWTAYSIDSSLVPIYKKTTSSSTRHTSLTLPFRYHLQALGYDLYLCLASHTLKFLILPLFGLINLLEQFHTYTALWERQDHPGNSRRASLVSPLQALSHGQQLRNSQSHLSGMDFVCFYESPTPGLQVLGLQRG